MALLARAGVLLALLPLLTAILPPPNPYATGAPPHPVASFPPDAPQQIVWLYAHNLSAGADFLGAVLGLPEVRHLKQRDRCRIFGATRRFYTSSPAAATGAYLAVCDTRDPPRCASPEGEGRVPVTYTFVVSSHTAVQAWYTALLPRNGSRVVVPHPPASSSVWAVTAFNFYDSNLATGLGCYRFEVQAFDDPAWPDPPPLADPQPVEPRHPPPRPPPRHTQQRTATVFNDRPRLDVHGAVVDCHSGVIVAHNGTYYMYGEAYGNQTGSVRDWKTHPQLTVYTSPDMEAWTPRGPMLTNPGAGTRWVPYVRFNPRTGLFVAWFGEGDWGVATSRDGIHFEVQRTHITSRLGGPTDGNDFFVDDDGSAYIIFSATALGHRVSIERLADDWLSSTHVNVTGFFPDSFIECPTLFKRNGLYYVIYGTCCCACRHGSGVVVLTAPAVHGPWTRQEDVNCVGGKPICGATDPVVIPAQWYGLAEIPVLGGDTAFMLMGNRWLSAPHNDPACVNLCGTPCAQPGYLVGHDAQYWMPLAFDDAGRILPFHPTPNFTLALP